MSDARRVLPVEAGVALLSAVARHARDVGRRNIVDKPAWLAKISGTKRLVRMINSGASADEIAVGWSDEVRAFEARRAPYLLYE